MNEQNNTKPVQPINSRPLTVAIASIILFFVFLGFGSGPYSPFISGAFGLLAVALAIIALRSGQKHPVQYIALALGIISTFMGFGLGIFTLIFVGAIPL